jgi:hypothetical protein
MGQWIVVKIDSEFRIRKETKPENEFYPPENYLNMACLGLLGPTERRIFKHVKMGIMCRMARIFDSLHCFHSSTISTVFYYQTADKCVVDVSERTVYMPYGTTIFSENYCRIGAYCTKAFL